MDKKNHKKFAGDILEAGVYKGKSLITTAMLLKKLNSGKRVFGFDSFTGFPPIYHANDEINVFKKLLDDGEITPEHYEDHYDIVMGTKVNIFDCYYDKIGKRLKSIGYTGGSVNPSQFDTKAYLKTSK